MSNDTGADARHALKYLPPGVDMLARPPKIERKQKAARACYRIVKGQLVRAATIPQPKETVHMANVNAAHATKLTAAGCPTQHQAAISAAVSSGGNIDEVCKVAALSPTFNWGALAGFLQQYGPSILAAILGLFGTPPAP